jgi:hypothetical protein
MTKWSSACHDGEREDGVHFANASSILVWEFLAPCPINPRKRKQAAPRFTLIPMALPQHRLTALLGDLC